MLLISAPHLCYNIVGLSSGSHIRTTDPFCDYRTNTFAQIIHEENPNSILVKSRTTRTICDNNRKKCRNTAMRKRLTNLMEEYQPDFVVVDVHSFSNGESWGLLWTPTVVLLDTHPSEETMLLTEMLDKENIDVVPIMGSTKNDVQVEAREHSGKGILLELWDQTDEEDVKKIGQVVQKWYKKISEL